ncbi:hypothetical protein SAMN04487936_10433 [Halobacillus dabanensis]|uniref:YesK-like protein n=1 Tax=Halobacillus dabanensis TaxID=240302 RepID=A0A1I3TUK7_HALDA|nr:hypothetical protein [Halobacillus dabanensis]SFJ74958.1 hypothetical protein SAMN04487936_10433 [Halobacillus dabanensis]
MEEILEILMWPVFIGFLITHVTLLLFKRMKAVLLTSGLMAGVGALLMVIGLIQHLLLGVYGVIFMLFGIVFNFLTKDHIESR